MGRHGLRNTPNHLSLMTVTWIATLHEPHNALDDHEETRAL